MGGMSAERHTRRSFLQGKAAARVAAGDRLDPAVERGRDDATGQIAADAQAQWASSSVHPAPLVCVRRRAMACDWEVQLAANRDDDSMEYIFQALDLVESLEDQMTVYRTDSEVVRINRLAAEHPVEVEPRLFEICELAAQIYCETSGAYDITSGPLSEVWGFSRRQGRVPSDEELAAALVRVGMSKVALDPVARTIAFRHAGVNVNFNSIGKGYALDRMAELLAEGAVDDYLLHGGRSSVLARGDYPHRPEEGWTIGVRNPLRPSQRIAEIDLHDQALSTSGSGTQFFERRGRRFGHILDPRTGRPAEGMFSATVIAPTAAAADALSTAFYVMGPTGTAEYCAAHPDVSALLVCPTEREGGVMLHTFNLADDTWRSELPAAP